MNKNKSFQRNLLIGLSFSLVVLVVSSSASYKSIQKLLQSFEWVNHTNEVNLQLNDIMNSLVDAETAMRGYLLTKNVSFLEPYTDAPKKITISLIAVDELTSDNALQRKNMAELKKLTAIELQIISDNVNAADVGMPLNRDSVALGKIYMDKIRRQIKTMMGIETRLLKIRSEGVSKLTTFTLAFIAVASILSISVTIYYFRKIDTTIDENIHLHAALEQKIKDSDYHINVIKDQAEKIAEGNYKARIDLDLLKKNPQER